MEQKINILVFIICRVFQSIIGWYNCIMRMKNINYLMDKLESKQGICLHNIPINNTIL